MLGNHLHRGRLRPAILLLLLLPLSRRAEAQGSDPTVQADASHGYRPAVSVDGAPGVELGGNAVQAAVSVRIPLGPRTFLTPGVSYRGQFLSYDGSPSPLTGDQLHMLEVPVMVMHIFDEHWGLLGGFAPGLAGDFDGLENHFRFTALALALYRFGPRLSIGVGAILDYGAGHWQPLPIATVDWNIAGGLYLKLGLQSKLLYRFGDRFEVSAGAEFEGGRYAIDRGDRTVRLISIDVVGQASVRLTGTTWLTFGVGWSAFRRFEVEDGPGEGDFDPQHGLVFRSGIEVRLPGM